MANITKNYLLATGEQSAIAELTKLFKKPAKTAELLSCELFRIYAPKTPRRSTSKNFGQCESFGSDKVGVWDIATDKKTFDKIASCEYLVEKMGCFLDDTPFVFLMFESAWSEPLDGFKKLVKQFKTCEFEMYCLTEGEEDPAYYIGENGKLKKRRYDPD